MPFPIEHNTQDAGRGVFSLLLLVAIAGILASVAMLSTQTGGALPYCGLALSGVVFGAAFYMRER